MVTLFSFTFLVTFSPTAASAAKFNQEVHAWQHLTTSTTSTPFERTSKRRKGFPSETQVKRGRQIVHGDKELTEKLGRNDPCLCNSGSRFQELLHADRTL